MRTRLISLRGLQVVPELAESLRLLEQSLSKVGDVRLKIHTSNFTTGMSSAGREIEMTLVSTKYSKKECVFILWGCAIPLGFTPMDRYPNLNTETKDTFHFLGEWETYHMNLLSRGLGEFAWESVCLAANLDVGQKRDITNFLVRYIQAQMGRWGLYQGLVDGIVSQEYQGCLATLGLQQKTEEDIINFLDNGVLTKEKKKDAQVGFISLKDTPYRVTSYGDISTTKKQGGTEVFIEGTGRIVIDVSLGNSIKVT